MVRFTQFEEMNMNQKALKILEFDKIIELLVNKASCELGKEQCRQLVPMHDLEEIQLAQRQTADALRRIYSKGSVSFSGTVAIGASLKRLEIGGSLNATELLRICGLLETAGRVKQYSRGDEKPEDQRDSLDDFFDSLEPCFPLSSEIRRCILSEDEIADDASGNLKSIRRQMKQLNDKVHSTLSSLLNGSARNYLQDAVITMRNGRYCLPVKAEYRGQVPGMIHDQSSTGSTLFVEPMSVVKINNDLKELELKEQEEIEVILAGLSAQAALYMEAIDTDLKVLAALDFIFAKALLAKDMNASEPLFNTKGNIYIDGQNVKAFTLKSLRQNIGMVQQDVYLFSGTIFENIAYGKNGASREEVMEAAKKAGAHEFIEKLKDGYDTYVGERGVKLSGGQKQRISIARVFLKNPPMIILDEATSALDNESEFEAHPHETFEQTAEHVRYLVTDAITRQMVSDVPIGTFLSGGLDSSIITAVCAEEMGKRGELLPTFSVDYLNNDLYFQPNASVSAQTPLVGSDFGGSD